MFRNIICICAVLVLAVLPSLKASGQCFDAFISGPITTTPSFGTDGPVNAMIAWAAPGQPTRLYIGGSFTKVGCVDALNIAAWDGARWYALGSGVDREVRSLAVWNGSLIAGGEFLQAGGVTAYRVAKWSGFAWSNLGSNSELGLGVLSDNEFVSALTVFNGDLIAGGNIVLASGNTTSNVVRWLGSGWASIAPITNHTIVNALEVFDDDGNGPHAPGLWVGDDVELRKYDAAYQQQTVLAYGPIYALTTVNSGLAFGGRFVVHFIFDSYNFAVYNGSTTSIYGVGVGGVDDAVRAIRAYGSDIIVGGAFASAGGVAVNNITRYSGSTWGPMDGGTETTVRALREFSGSMIVGGSFFNVNGVLRPNIARWNVSSWGDFFVQAGAYAFAPLGTRCVAAGSFYHQGNPQNIIAWNGVQLQTLGSGVNGPVNALRGYVTSGTGGSVNNLVAAGDFNNAGGVFVNRVARYAETDNIFTTGWFAMGTGFNSAAYVVDIGYQGVIIAGGAFTGTGVGAPLGRMARWSVSLNEWIPFATAGGSDMNGAVRTIKVYTVSPTNPLSNVVTVAGGDFTTANGQPRNRIAMWIDNPSFGSTPWAAMGDGFNGPVYAIERHSGSIYAAGDFTASGATPLGRIARWTGTAWVAVGTGSGFDGPIYTLKSVNGALYAGGAFSVVNGSLSMSKLAKWNGTAWVNAIGGSVISNIMALGSYMGEIEIGGMYAAGNSSPQIPWRRILPTTTPWLAQQPIPQSVACHSTMNMSITVASGYAIESYQWRRNGVPVIDGPTPANSFIVGATTPTLSIQNIAVADAGAYDCIATTFCDPSVTSTAANVTVGNCCPADIAPPDGQGFYGDGVVNVTDLLAVITTWGACAAPCPPKCVADIAPIGTGDCVVNVSDLLGVITAWGPCP